MDHLFHRDFDLIILAVHLTDWTLSNTSSSNQISVGSLPCKIQVEAIKPDISIVTLQHAHSAEERFPNSMARVAALWP